MIFLAITADGLNEALRVSKMGNAAVWCGSDAISQQEYKEQRHDRLTRFNYPLRTADDQTLLCAVQTIEEHHPNERIWVEAKTEA